MLSLPSVRLGRLFGIPLEVNVTWLVIFGLVATSLSFSYFPSVAALEGLGTAAFVLMGCLTALSFFASIVLHELSHSLVARAGGIRIAKVTLFMFGGVAQMEDEPHGPGHEFLMAIAGPGASLLLSGALFGAVFGGGMAGAPEWLLVPASYLGGINLSVAVFNLLPGFPLDGGRVLRALLWATTGDILKATRWASRSGQAIGVAMIAGAVIGVLWGTLDFVWFGVVGWFITGLAESAYRQQVMRSRLAGVRVEAVMTPHPLAVPGEISVENLADDWFLGARHSRYPVVVDGRIVGLVTLAGAKSLPREMWSTTKVADIAVRDLAELLVSTDSALDSVLSRLGPSSPGALLAVRDGLVVGIVTREDVLREMRTLGSP